ncbi:MAG: glycosyltransferase family 39 protein [Candidatus Melainabacteria bacterium]|nr:glycosyltransferase family 39 protein [Candidatus Melainabacteria bacterium]
MANQGRAVAEPEYGARSGAGRSSGDATFAASRLKALLLLAVACFALYFTGLGDFPAIDPAEGYYVEAAREMVELGDYVVPYLNHQIYFSKPIMTFWLIAASYNLFGLSEWAARLPYAILSTLLVIGSFWTASVLSSNASSRVSADKNRQDGGCRAGLIAALSLACAPLLLLVSRTSPVDIAFSVFLCLSVMATAVTMAGASRFAWVLIYAGLGLAMLAKGPAAILLYGLGALGFLAISRPSPAALLRLLAKLKVLAGLPVFLAVVLPWHYLVYKATDGLFLKVFFLYENVARYAGHTNMGKMSWWFFIPTILAGFFPFILLTPALAGEALGLAGKGKTSGFPGGLTEKLRFLVVEPARQIAMDNRICGLAFLLAFSFTTFVFFSLSGTKLITYILPVLAPLAVLVGVRVDSLLVDGESENSTKGSSFWLTLLSGSFLVFGAAGALATFVAAFLLEGISVFCLSVCLAAACLLFCGAVWQWRQQRRGRLESAVRGLFVTYVVALAVFAPVGFHIFGTRLQGDLRTVSIAAREFPGAVSMFGVFMPSAMFYARKPINTFFVLSQVRPDQSSAGEALLIRDLDRGRFEEVPGLRLEEIARAGEWGLYRAPGYRVETIMTLSDVFANAELFDALMKGSSPTGPLTVPYARGSAGLSKTVPAGVSLAGSEGGK